MHFLIIISDQKHWLKDHFKLMLVLAKAKESKESKEIIVQGPTKSIHHLMGMWYVIMKICFSAMIVIFFTLSSSFPYDSVCPSLMGNDRFHLFYLECTMFRNTQFKFTFGFLI